MKKTAAALLITFCVFAADFAGSGFPVSAKQSSAEVEIADPDTALEGTLTISSFYMEEQTKHMIDLFQQENPGVEIVTRSMFGVDSAVSLDTQEAYNVYAAELASEECADIYDTTFLSVAKYWNSGYFEDLNPYIDADPDFDRDDYYDNVLRACECGGALYQMPQGFYYFMLRLNKGITEQLNYEIPESMSYKDVYELFAAASEAELVQDGFILDSHEPLYNIMFPAEARTAINISDKTTDLASDGFIDFLHAVSEMYPYRPQTAEAAYEDVRAFSDNNCLLNYFGSDIYYGPENLYGETETASAPVLFTSSDGELPFIRTGDYLTMTSSSKNKALAWEFIKFCVKERDYDFSNPDSDNYYRNFYTYAAMINRANSRKLAEFFLEDADTAARWEAANEKVSAQAFNENQIYSLLYDYFYECAKGELSPEETAGILQQRVELFIKE